MPADYSRNFHAMLASDYVVVLIPWSNSKLTQVQV